MRRYDNSFIHSVIIIVHSGSATFVLKVCVSLSVILKFETVLINKILNNSLGSKNGFEQHEAFKILLRIPFIVMC